MRRTVVLLPVLILLNFFQSHLMAQNSDECPRRLVYDHTAQSLTIRETITGETLFTLETPNIFDFDSHSTSPDCQYGAGLVWHTPGNPRIGDTNVWDLRTGELVAIYEDAHIWSHRITWSPDSTRVMVETRFGAFLWNPFADSRVQITDLPMADWWLRLRWDSATYEVFVLPKAVHRTGRAVTVYDWRTGILTERYESDNCCSELEFMVTLDRTRIIIFPAYSTDNGRISVWDRRTGQRVDVVAGSDGADAVSPLSTSEPRRIALSPDGRYLVIVRTTIRVWDLTNLSANLDDRAPTYRWQGADARFAEVRFVNNTTIETKDYNDTIQRWNILTGEELPLP